jgi:hypothetical protein
MNLNEKMDHGPSLFLDQHNFSDHHDYRLADALLAR